MSFTRFSETPLRNDHREFKEVLWRHKPLNEIAKGFQEYRAYEGTAIGEWDDLGLTFSLIKNSFTEVHLMYEYLSLSYF